MSASRILGPLAVAAFAAFGLGLVVSGRSGPLPGPIGSGPPKRVSESGRTPHEEEAVAGALQSGLRAALDDDADESEAREELRSLYGDYRPYFVRGDFDGDGHLDFAQAFVRRDGPQPLFDVAVFFGTSPEGFSGPVWVQRGLLLSGGDLSVDRSVLVVTEDVEAEVSSRWRWDPSAGRFIDVDAGTGDSEPWTDPDAPVGTTA